MATTIMAIRTERVAIITAANPSGTRPPSFGCKWLPTRIFRVWAGNLAGVPMTVEAALRGGFHG